MADLLDAAAKPATLCAFCPKMCTFACPVSSAEGRETVTPWAKMSLVHLSQGGEVSLANKDVQEALEACTGCGACVEQCAHGNPVAETLFVARGVAKSERAERHKERFERTGDVKGRDLRPALERLPRDAHAKVAYFPGCTRLSEAPQKAERDLEALGIAMGASVSACELPAGKLCCGYPLYADGQLDALAGHLKGLEEILQGHELVVTPDPGCAYTLSVVRRGLLGERSQARWPQIVPLVEVLAQRAERFSGKSQGLVVRYHDPCYLGRRGRTFSAPRALVAAATGQAPLEFAMKNDEADCSGAGGLYPVSNPDGALRAAERRLNEDGNAHVPIDAVVTACPSAARNFRRTGARVFDVVDVVLGRLEDE
jgi:dimethylglycine catabolism B